jgi:hypothetical protein
MGAECNQPTSFSMKSSIKSSTSVTKGFISMRTDISNAGRPAYYTIREAAWILGVKPSTLSRAIRLVRQPQSVMSPGVS